jgi:D-glycerate 3-kinase
MQEKKLWLSSKKKKNLKIMSKGDVINFMQTYQRITQNMFKETPKYASIILKLTSNHQIKSMIYKKNY